MDQPLPPDESIPTLVGRLIDDTKQFVRAEVTLYRAKLTPRIGGVRNAAILALSALFLLQAVVVAGLVGLMLALLPSVGIGWAVAIVVLGGLAIIALLGWLAWTQLRGVIGPDEKVTRP